LFLPASGQVGPKSYDLYAAAPAVVRRLRLIFHVITKIERRENIMATTINLRDFYPWYTQDEFAEVSDEVAEELIADKRHCKAQERQMYRYKAHYSLDVDNGIESAAVVRSSDDPQTVLEKKERHCRLCMALNALPEIQGRRIEAHFILGRSQAEIAGAEGVTKGAVSVSVTRGLAAMKKHMKNSVGTVKLLPENCQCC
jgi:RNA polymerase sigma-70 factor (ECF subfamily)